MLKSISELQKVIGYDFKNQSLLKTAVTHSSFGDRENYERLEFLGDRVLALVISHFLYEKFPQENEGDLAKRLAALVQGAMLAKLATKISLGDYINLSASERDSGGAANEHILADVFESLIGAMYLDGGFTPCRHLIESQWGDVFETMHKPPQHPKTEVQEWAQSQGLPLPLYEIVTQSGPDHAPVFVVQMMVRGQNPTLGQGRSRAQAERNAAIEFLKLLHGKNHDGKNHDNA